MMRVRACTPRPMSAWAAQLHAGCASLARGAPLELVAVPLMVLVDQLLRRFFRFRAIDRPAHHRPDRHPAHGRAAPWQRCIAHCCALHCCICVLLMLIVASCVVACCRLHVARSMAQARCAQCHAARCSVCCCPRYAAAWHAVHLSTARRAPAQCSALPSAQRKSRRPTASLLR